MHKQIYVVFPLDNHTSELLKVYIYCNFRGNCTCFCSRLYAYKM